jgi:hypothetical protein
MIEPEICGIQAQISVFGMRETFTSLQTGGGGESKPIVIVGVVGDKVFLMQHLFSLAYKK